MAEVRWTEEAAERLGEIFAYIAETSPQAAAETVERIRRHAETLDRFSERPEFPQVVLWGPCRLVYRTNPSADIILLGAFFSAMDLSRYSP